MKITRLKQVTTKQNYLKNQNQKGNALFFICCAAFMFFNFFLNAQELSEVDYDSSEKNFKSINASVGLGNAYALKSYLLTFEKNGIFGSGFLGSEMEIEQLFNTGFYIDYENYGSNSLAFGLRVALDPLGFVNQFSNTQIQVAQKLDINVGVQWGYSITVNDYSSYTRFRRAKFYLNTRYYLTKNIGVHAEFGETAAFSKLNVGISLRY